MIGLRRFVAACVLLLSLCACPLLAGAQTLPVQVQVSGNVATATIGDPAHPLADITLTFENARGLSASSLGLGARLVDVQDAALLARLPSLQLNQLDALFPLLITIEPPALGGLRFRTVRVDVHTHALVYSVGSSYRLFKAPLNGAFRDITDEIAPGSVRARGTTGGFSQFLVLTDLRESSEVVAHKIGTLRARVAILPAAERPGFNALLDQVDTALAQDDFAGALAAVGQIDARARARAGTHLQQEWRATRDADNQAGDLIAGAATLGFSIAYLRDFGD
jgi:hypothetical protein